MPREGVIPAETGLWANFGHAPLDPARTPDPVATKQLARLGVTVYVHGRVFGVVRDQKAPHGYRVVGSAKSIAALAAKLSATR